MYSHIARSRQLNLVLALVCAALSIVGCSTPQHSNTLIFGTTTRFAVDVSQEPTGSLGVTIGYKRNEAVWMPLLANTSEDRRLVPAECEEDSCRKYVGTAGTGGGAAGANAIDTYSVLATFSGSASGAAANPQAQATLAQYFATGLAARLLAQYGGAAVVNSAAYPTESSAIAAEVSTILTVKKSQVGAIVGKLSKTTGDIDPGSMAKLLTLDPAKGLHADIRTRLAGIKTRVMLEADLLDGPEKTVETIFLTIDRL